MEVFATFALILLVGLVIPIMLLLGALIFDLAVVFYLAIARMRLTYSLKKRAA